MNTHSDSLDGEILCLNVCLFGWWNSMSECVLIRMVKFYVWMCAHLDGELRCVWWTLDLCHRNICKSQLWDGNSVMIATPIVMISIPIAKKNTITRCFDTGGPIMSLYRLPQRQYWMCAYLDGEFRCLNVCSFGWWISMFGWWISMSALCLIDPGPLPHEQLLQSSPPRVNFL